MHKASFAKIESMKLLTWLLVGIGILIAQASYAYPEFIGYGYSSCLTCHVNGLGSGPLNDYGRALWSAEIASRAFYPKSMSDEDIANQSGFLGPIELPFWIRPHFKYRDINLRQHFKGPLEEKRYYRMQEDIGLTLSDSVGKYVAMITWGNLQYSGEGDKQRILAREYYFRTEVVKTWWVYVGLMEKVFGIRNINHASFQRSPQGFNPTLNSTSGISQSQGIIVHKIEDTWEVAANAFFGNPYDDPEYRHKGFSAMTEFEVGEKKRLGASFLQGKSDLDKKSIYAIHYRQGLSKGSAMLFEYGLLNDEVTGSTENKGSYNMLQSIILLTRGYNLRTEIERYNRDFKATEPDVWRWSIGLQAFPLPRLELRADVINGRSFSNGPVNDDDWTFQGLMHVSL